jgi:hypothetical protein
MRDYQWAALALIAYAIAHTIQARIANRIEAARKRMAGPSCPCHACEDIYPRSRA